MSKDFMDDKLDSKRKEKIVPEFQTVSNGISQPIESAASLEKTDVNRVSVTTAKFNLLSIQDFSCRAFLSALPLAFLVTILSQVVIGRIQAGNWNWFNVGHFSQLLRMILSMSGLGFFGSVVFALVLWVARASFKNQLDRFLTAIPALFILSSVSPILLVLPVLVPTGNLAYLYLQQWISHIVFPGVCGGLAYLISLMLIACVRARSKSN